MNKSAEELFLDGWMDGWFCVSIINVCLPLSSLSLVATALHHWSFTYSLNFSQPHVDHVISDH